MLSNTSKICLIGDFSVGKTSLVQRFVNNHFDESYLTTVGVKIDTKVIPEQNNKLIIWDIAGSSSIDSIKQAYIQGASGYLLIYDLSRASSFRVAMDLQAEVERLLGHIPFVLVGNKNDLTKKLDDGTVQEYMHIIDQSCMHLETSALTGQGVENAFIHLSKAILEFRSLN